MQANGLSPWDENRAVWKLELEHKHVKHLWSLERLAYRVNSFMGFIVRPALKRSLAV